jgi:hypothetical protein
MRRFHGLKFDSRPPTGRLSLGGYRWRVTVAHTDEDLIAYHFGNLAEVASSHCKTLIFKDQKWFHASTVL